jgi:hypothetical protein
MSCKLGHPEFDAALEGSLDYLIHGFARWSCVFRVYSLGVSLKGPALVRFLVLKKIKIKKNKNKNKKIKNYSPSDLFLTV